MSDPINPNTLVPMSLEVERIENIRQVHSSNEQKMLAQNKQKEDKKKEKSVNKKEKSENLIIDKEDEKKQKQEKDNQDEDKDEKQENKNNKQKGSVIDVRI